MRFKYLLTTIIILIKILFADTDLKSTNIDLKSAIYGNFLGQSPMLSINYDKHIINNKVTLFSGIGIYPVYFAIDPAISAGINFLFGENIYKELGFGGTGYLGIKSKESLTIIPNISIGFRYQPQKGKFIKINIVPYLNIQKHKIVLIPGVSFGISL